MLAATSHKSPKLPGVNLYGPVGVVSGLGVAARGYVSAFRTAGIDLSVVPVHELFIHQPSIGKVYQYERPIHPISVVQINADSVHRFVHFHGRTFRRSRYKIGLWVWEMPALRDEWLRELEYFDEIWVPSTFCQRAVRAVTDKPVVLMPYAILPPREFDRSVWRRRLEIKDTEFVLLYVFDASSLVERKNPQCLVDAFLDAFPDHPDVRLILKVSNTEHNGDFSMYLNRLVERDSRCVVLREITTAAEVTALMATADCYISPHRSEGFGLTVAEAMALGVPVVATDWGGTADFVTEEVGFPLNYSLIEVEQDYGPYGKGAIWAEPSREHLVAILRAIAANPEVAVEKGVRARAHIRQFYSPEAIGRQAGERLAQIQELNGISKSNHP